LPEQLIQANAPSQHFLHHIHELRASAPNEFRLVFNQISSLREPFPGTFAAPGLRGAMQSGGPPGPPAVLIHGARSSSPRRHR
jgi:hypothetical protein